MDQVEEIKKRIDVVGLISSYLSLKKAGKNYKACCPFHKEKTASFMVSPEKQIWYCFGCNQGGDIYNFVEKIEGIDFAAALHLLADRAGVILDRKNFTQKGEKNKYFEMMDLAARFFNFILDKHPNGKEAKEYLIKKRGISEKSIQEFSIGYAPNSNGILSGFLEKKEFSKKEIEKVGLVAQNYQGKSVDKFRDRIIFPIRNTNGKIVAFGGRIFKEPKSLNFTPPKYLNSPQTDIYDKSSTLYGLDSSREAIREKDLVIIVEGYLDVISSHQIGVQNVVASSGTALTTQQVEILSRYTNNIAFCFDSDEAGVLATKRAMEITQFSDINVKAIRIEGAKDPDELIQTLPQKWIEAACHPIPILEFYYAGLMKKYQSGKNTEEKKKITGEFIPILKNVYNDVEKAYWIKRVSQDLGVNEKYIMEAMEKAQSHVEYAGTKIKNDGSLQDGVYNNSVKIKISKEMLLLSILALYPAKAKEFFDQVKIEDISEDLGKNVYKTILDWHNSIGEKKEISLEYLKEKTAQEKQKDLDLIFFLALSFLADLEEKEILGDIDSLIQQVLKEKREKRKKAIEMELAHLDKTKDKIEVKELLKELQGLI